jgi:hypothetical protein
VSAISLVVNKPTGTVDGDLMLALVQLSRLGVTVSAPAGWTLVDSDTATAGTHLFKKVASGEGSTFTFTASVGGNTAAVGIVISLYDTVSGSPVVGPFTETVDGSADTTADNTGVTPTLSPGSLLLACMGGPGAATTFSAYAVANNNPTWTEAKDNSNTFAGETCSAAVAYATGRDLITATGAFSATIGASLVTAVYLLSIQPSAVSVTVPLMNLALSPLAPAVSMVSNFAVPLMNLTLSIPTPSVATADPLWQNPSKHSASATNTTKHAAVATNTSKSSSVWTNVDKT